MLNRGVLWLRKSEAFIGFSGKWETRQCIINNNEFHKHCSTWLHFVLHATQLVFIYSFVVLLFPSHPLPFFSFFSPLFLLTAWHFWHLHSSVFVRKKRRALFFQACCVVSDSFLSPSCVPCLLSHQWNIEESTEHVSNPHVCCWVVLQGRLLSPLRFGGAVCACGLWVWEYVCVCVYFCACSACNPLGMRPHERS